MFAKVNRLKKESDFKKIFKDGKFIREETIEARILPNNLNVCRFGFVTSLRISKKATVRNKIRRRLSEAVKTLAPLINDNFDILIVAKAKIIGKSGEEIIKDVENIFKKAGVYS